MIAKGLAIFAAFAVCVTLTVPITVQGKSKPTASPAATTDSGAAKAECNGAPCPQAPAASAATKEPPPSMVVSVPPAPPAPWPMHDRIVWAADIVLAIVGYIGVMLAVVTLRKIDTHTRYLEVAAETASNTAQAALLSAQALVAAGRPWVSVAVKPSPTEENSFIVTATNRGNSPAKIVGISDRLIIVGNEAQLPSPPEYVRSESGTPFVPIILLPGESTPIRPFSREDVKAVCLTEERLAKVENWEEKVFLYGRVLYWDLISPTDKQVHETNWCCWYIHGRQKSGLVMAGSHEYNLHT